MYKKNKKNLHRTFQLILLDRHQRQQSSLINKRKKKRKIAKKLQIEFAFHEKKKINNKKVLQYKFQEDYFILLNEKY